MRLVRCENCGQEKTDQLPTANWIEADYMPPVMLTYAETTGPWHFHTFLCLSVWAGQRATASRKEPHE